MTVIGYARVSTTDQDLSIQEGALRAAGCDVVRAEKQSGTSTEGRAELRTVLDFIGKGDVLLVTRVDRLARSIGDLQDIVRALKAKGAILKATEQPIDTGTAAGKCFLDMLGVVRGVSGVSIFVASANLRASPRPRRPAFTGAGNHPSTRLKCRSLSPRGWVPLRLRNG